MRCYAYTRVSTEEQNTDNQLPGILALAASRGWTLDRVFADKISGTKQKRPGLDELLREVGPDDVLICARLDRMGRSMLHTINLVTELDQRGVRLVSVSEPWLDTSGPMRSLLLAVFAWFAEYERTLIVDRTKAGLARAKSEGIKLGRPKVSTARLADAAQRVAAGLAVSAACQAAGVSPAAFYRWRSSLNNGLPVTPPQDPPEGTGEHTITD